MDNVLNIPWWQEAVFYQVYPRSFADANGDGVGDLNGIVARLDHLAWLGVDALWLSPIYASPMADFGYDVSDHRAVEPVFGTLEDFDRLLAEVHARGMRLILDWVPNHTSDQHPWFFAARSSREDPHREWYLWRDGRIGPNGERLPPNNWRSAFLDRSAWTFDSDTGQWYLHLFLSQQPDLNWANPAVEEAMHGVLRFWLDRGVDGFRADVVHLIGKDPSLPDDPPARVGTSRVRWHDEPAVHPLLRGIRRTLGAYPGDRMMVGEVNLADTAQIAAYHGEGDELHLAFNFVPLGTVWSASAWRAVIEEIERVYGAVPARVDGAVGAAAGGVGGVAGGGVGGVAGGGVGAWPTWVLSNHDVPRHRTRYGTDARARAAAVLLLTLRGTPFLYAGEELGLSDAVVPPDRVVDPGGRDGCRAPVPWTADEAHGWPTDPWLPWPPDADRRNAQRLRQDEGSILWLYRRLLEVRRASPALRIGGLELHGEGPADVLAYRRHAGEDERLVVVNFADAPRSCEQAWLEDWDVELSTTWPSPADLRRLGPDEARVLRRRSGQRP